MLYYLGTQERATKYRGVEQMVARRAHNPEVGGSSPPSATIKETSFVYQDERGFFLLSGKNIGQIREKRALGRSIGYSEARFFSFHQQKYTEIAVVQIEFLCFASNY